MFTGIIQSMGNVVFQEGSKIEISTTLEGLKTGHSVAIEGVCLTVTKSRPDTPKTAPKRSKKGAAKAAGKATVLSFDVSPETLSKTTLGSLKPGQTVNLEPSARMGDPLGGHFVLGHVDGTGSVASVTPDGESKIYEFAYPSSLRKYLVPKGSIAVDGISLTIVKILPGSFTVAIIPFTEQNTTLGRKKAGDPVNLEADILSKHMVNMIHAWQGTTDDLFMKRELSWEEISSEQ
ncbi:MAG TPA: riboflavin synthase [Elusimicrobiota bacterium]|nr:riboflavin synthase [Elusimicrobiota bacterium]